MQDNYPEFPQLGSVLQAMTPQGPYLAEPAMGSRPGTGWRRDLPDQRDHWWAASQQELKALPTLVDHREAMPPHLHQLELSSCVANTTAYAFDFERQRGGRGFIYPSRLFQYYNTRVLEGTIDSDSGSSIRNAIKAMVDYGMCPETMWPYVTSQYRTGPPVECYVAGLKAQVIEYMRVGQTAQELMAALSAGYVIAFGMQIYPQFENCGPSGMIQLPSFHDRPLGGHSMCGVGYWIDSGGSQWVIGRGSWGTSHGDGGDVYIPMAYLTNPQLAADFWIVQMIEPDPTPAPTPAPAPWVGDGILAKMAEYGDSPADGEWFVDPAGTYRIAYGVKGIQYTYIAKLDKVFAFVPMS